MMETKITPILRRLNTYRYMFIVSLLCSLLTISFGVFSQTTGPGGVTANLRVWLKADVGFSPSQWQDQSGVGNTYTQTNVNVQPSIIAASKTTNFNPIVDFGVFNVPDVRNHFMVVPNGKPFTADGKDGTVFMNIRKKSNLGGWHDYVMFGGTTTTDIAPAHADYPNFLIAGAADVPVLYPYYATPSNTTTAMVANNVNTQVDGSWKVGGTMKYGKNGLNYTDNTYTSYYSGYALTAQGSMIGAQYGEGCNCEMGEVIAYERQLTNGERSKVRSYLAIKGGITLLQDQDYVASDSSIVWNSNISIADQAFNNNIFGIGRDNKSTLHQKVSNSVDGNASILTVATSNDFTSANAVVTRTAIATDKSYLMFGDNDNTTTVLRNLTTSDCPALDPNANVKRIERVWLVQKTGTPGGVYLNADLSSYAINTKVFMLVADDANFTVNVQKIAGVYNNSKGTFAYEFKSKKYITFGGEIDATVCVACENGAFKIATAKEWWDHRCCGLGNTWATNKYGPYSPGSTGTGTVQATLELLDPHNVEWVADYRPWVWGYEWLWMRRYSSTDLMTYRVTLNQKAKSTFQIGGINAYLGTDVVTVKGYCNNGATLVTPKLTRKREDFPSFTISGNVATGDKWWGEGGEYGTVRVEFERPVERIDIEWKYSGSPSSFYTSDLFISDMVFECPAALPPNADVIYVQQKFTDNEIPSCKDAEMKLTFTNENCDPRVINLTNVLPVGLTYIDNSYNGISLPNGTVQPVYSGQNFSLTGLTIPSGKYDVYVKVKPSAAGTYNTQGNYTVISSGNTYKTIGDANTGVTGDNTVLTVTASTPVVKPDTMYMSVNKTCFAVGDTLTYTVSFNNTKGVTIPKVKFENFVDSTKLKLMTGSLSTTFGGTANAYGSSSYLTIDDMTLPIGGSSISYKAIVLAAVDTLHNQALINVDPTSECGGESAYLTTMPLNLPKCADCGTASSIQANGSATPTPVCSGANVSLTAVCSAGTATWYTIGTSSNVQIGTGSPLVQNPTATTTYGVVCKVDTNCVAVFSATNKITVTVQPVVAAPINNVSAAGTNAICVGSSTALTATCGTGTTPIWYIGTAVAGTGSPLTVSPTATTTYTAKCKSTATSCESATTSANDVVVTVNPVVAVPTGISSGTTAICIGASTTLNATCAMGTTPIWYIGAGVAGTGSPLTVSPTATTTYTAKCKSTATSCESVSTVAENVSVTVNPVVSVPTGISSSAGTTAICAGTTTTLNSTCASGTTPVWYLGTAVAGTGSPLTVSPTATTTYTAKCKSTASSCESVSTLAEDLIITVNPVVTVPTGISSSASGAICVGSSSSLSASCASGTTVVWYIGAGVAGTGSPLTVSPTMTTTYTAKCKSTATSCESSSTVAEDITITVNPLVPAPTGLSSSGGTTICGGSTNLSASCASGTTPVWYIGTAVVATGSPLSVTPIATTTYTAKCKSDASACESASTSANDITIIVVVTPASPTGVSAASSTICPGGSTTVSGICASGTTLIWYIGTTQVGIGSTLTIAPTTTTIYRATCKSAVGSCESTSSSDVTVTVGLPAIPSSITSSNGTTLCSGNSSSSLSATCASGSIVQWYIGAVFVGTGSPLAVAPLSTTTYSATCKSSSGSCESAIIASTQVILTVSNCTISTNTVPTKATPKDAPSSGTASTELNPQGGTGPYTYKAINCTSGSASVAQGTSVTTAGGGSLVVSNQSTGAYTYTPATNFVGTDTYCIEICDASTPNKICRIVTYSITVNATNGLMNVKALLQGALSGTIMTTALNTQNLIPMTDPYGKGATTTSTTLSGNAITDWVLVELRSAPGTVTEGIAALLKNDGTIVNPDGSSPLKFTTTSGNFYLSVRHRNHLGVMSANMVAINTTVQTIDFTNLSTATYGNNAQVIVGSVKAMWAGNSTGINLTGTDNVRYSNGDISAVTGFLTAQAGSAGGVKTNVYTKEDLNLDGIVRYSGGTRDILPITTTITTHPSNPSPGSTGFIVSQTF